MPWGPCLAFDWFGTFSSSSRWNGLANRFYHLGCGICSGGVAGLRRLLCGRVHPLLENCCSSDSEHPWSSRHIDRVGRMGSSPSRPDSALRPESLRYSQPCRFRRNRGLAASPIVPKGSASRTGRRPSSSRNVCVWAGSV